MEKLKIQWYQMEYPKKKNKERKKGKGDTKCNKKRRNNSSLAGSKPRITAQELEKGASTCR